MAITFLLDFVGGQTESDAFTLQWSSYPIPDSIQMTNINSCRKTDPWYCDEEIQPVIEEAWMETNWDDSLALRRQAMRH